MLFNWRRKPSYPKRVSLLACARTVPLFAGLKEAELTELARLVDYLADRKSVTLIEPLQWDEVSVDLLFLLMALPVLGLGEAGLAGWEEIILYPQPFVVRGQWSDHIGLVHEGESILIGQARSDGPLILSWADVKASARRLDGWNVVVHEMAHKLDMLNGDANGFPPLHKGMSRQQWARDWSAAYGDFCRRVEESEDGWLDPYAAEHPAEFFAVLSEAFFECPHEVESDFPVVYRHLVQFYRQDPARRL
jgi:hypothetical protein